VEIELMKYEDKVLLELRVWQRKMTKNPSIIGRLTKGIQVKTNKLIPEKVHDVITKSIKNMVRAVLIGSEYTTKRRLTIKGLSLEERENQVREKLSFYKKTAAAEGAGTGAGGIFLGLADFPLLLSIKMKFLFDTASIYGFDVRDYRERLYILHLFQLAFSSERKRSEIYWQIYNWEDTVKAFPANLEAIDWRAFQQEYRDYIDLAKLFQMIPGIGAIVGAYANFQLLDKLGETAMNGYRLRLMR